MARGGGGRGLSSGSAQVLNQVHWEWGTVLSFLMCIPEGGLLTGFAMRSDSGGVRFYLSPQTGDAREKWGAKQ